MATEIHNDEEVSMFAKQKRKPPFLCDDNVADFSK